MKTDFKTENNHNFTVVENDLQLFTSDTVNIYALKNKIDSEKLSLMEGEVDFTSINDYIQATAYIYGLGMNSTTVDELEYRKGNLLIRYGVAKNVK